MATTETRTGFRLPWAADRASSREGEEIDSPAEDDGRDLEADYAADAETPIVEQAGEPREHTSTEAVTPADRQEAHAAEAPAPARRPTKFMADLVKAMRAATEEARTASLEQFRHDNQAFVEQIHARSATQVEDLRRRTDDDVAEIKDWSKAEIARIREETEERISARRRLLDGQLERHAALVEREIEKVRTRVAAYETEMQAFFDRMLAEEDPSLVAAMAAQLPEPPTFEEIDEAAVDELLREPDQGAVETAPQAGVAGESVAETELTEAPAETTDGQVEAAAAAETSPDLEHEMAAIQAAAEAAAAAETGPDQAGATEGDEGAAGGPVTGIEDASGSEVDPRIAMLGLTPDFAAAEAEAAASASAYAGRGPDEMGEESVSARLAGLVQPATAAEEPGPTVTTQVVVVGLVSVASIASFKRHLGRLAGVAHVGVSSGPDGEFVYAVAHDPAVVLADLVPTIPGFGARVTGTGDGVVNVSAGDPES